MAFQKKIWTDRVAEFINRRILTHEDGTEQIVTVARSEGTVSQEGDAFDAKTMNDLENRVEAAFEEVNESLTARFNEKTYYLEVLIGGSWVNFAPYKNIVITSIANEYYSLSYNLAYNPTTNIVGGTITITVKTPNSNWVSAGSINVPPKSRLTYGNYSAEYPEMEIKTSGEITCAGGTAGQIYIWTISYDAS